MAGSRLGAGLAFRGVQFSRELRNDVLSGAITLSVRLWTRPQVKVGGRYPVGHGEIEVDAVDLVPFSAVDAADVRRAGERDLETLRRRAAHAGPIHEDTLVYRIEFHALGMPHPREPPSASLKLEQPPPRGGWVTPSQET